jgi:predicted GIY-YIG superfamily endonuclease
MFRIYKITNKVNGKLYIGFTSLSVDERLTQHFKDSNRGKSKSPLHKAMRHYGIENFSIEEIYTSKDENHTLNEMEAYFIKQFNSMVKIGNGYNVQPGGAGNKSAKKRPVDVYDKDLNFIRTFDKMKDAAEFLGSIPAIVSGTCKRVSEGKGGQIKGFLVCYAGSVPIKRDYSYLIEHNKKLGVKKRGTKRPEHSEYMKKNDVNADKTVYNFINKDGRTFIGTRKELTTKYPNEKIGSGGLSEMIKKKYKHHRGWSLI